jgi:hypothetical protein
MRFTKIGGVINAGRVAALCVAAQQPPCSQRTTPVSVMNQAGQPVTGLTSANFTGKFNGRPLHISSVTPSKSPPAVLILLDTSGSMVNFPGGLKGELDLVDLLLAQFPADVPACRRASPPSAKNSY